ncbi:MAG TPA: hypothetical protein VK961_18935 [Chthoniobacter sp.]|nr:hypothetical protein [Chthoniobacter sp.]
MPTPLPRRSALKVAAAFTASLSLGLRRACAAGTELADAAQVVHDEIWRRFIDEYGILVDYTDLDGHFPRATAEECREGKPNALGWWTPTENGSMFNGMYMDAIVHRWKLSRAGADKEKARTLMKGLLRLSTLGPIGFIARNVADDGKTPYPMGSNDQTGPWFYGLWRYVHEGLATSEERDIIVDQMVAVATVLAANRWLMPCNTGAPSPFRGSFAGFSWETAPRLLFVLKAMHELTRDAKWADMYQKAVEERGTPPLPPSAPGAPAATPFPQQSRLEICRKGMEFHGRWRHSWTCASGIICLRGLWEMETNASYLRAYAQGLSASLQLATESLPIARQFDKASTAVCLIDWRELNAWWQPQHSEMDAVNVAERQAKELGRLSPRRWAEFNQVRESLFAAWIVTMCPDRSLVEPHRAAILEAIQHFDYKRLYYSQFFPAEAAAYRLQLLEKA